MKYRDNALDVNTIKTLSVTQDLTLKVATFVAQDFKLMDVDEYKSWVTTWKNNYKHIAELIRSTKDISYSDMLQFGGERSRQHSLHSCSILANTLLNARQYAKDIRRDLYETGETK